MVSLKDSCTKPLFFNLPTSYYTSYVRDKMKTMRWKDHEREYQTISCRSYKKL